MCLVRKYILKNRPIVHKSTLLPKLGMAEHLSVPTMQLVPHLLSGSDIPSGSRKCGRASSTAWLPI